MSRQRMEAVTLARKPARPASVASDVLAPLLQALVTALIVAGLVLWLVVRAAWPVELAGVAFMVTLALVWFFLLVSHRHLLWDETVTPLETPAMPLPPVETAQVRLEVVDEAAGRVAYAHLPLPLATLRTLARAIATGQPFTVARWTGRGKPLSRGQFETVRTWLLNDGYARWVDGGNRQLGVEMTAKGQALWRELAGR